MGSGFDDEVFLMFVIWKEYCDKVLDYIELGMKEGVEFICDGCKEMDEYMEGNFLGVIIFDCVIFDMIIVKEEIFVFVLSLFCVDILDEVFCYMEKFCFGNGVMIYIKDVKVVC